MNQTTNIHGICLVKDEADIIGQSLESALKWCDFIYVYDNGSTDGTWEKVLELAKWNQSIIPYKQDDKTFHDSLRGEVLDNYRENATEEDWWCTLDADEIYIDDPRIFLQKVSRQYKVVWSASFQYYFTDKDLEQYQQDPSLYAEDIPVEHKCRYYLNNWGERRFFRHRKNLRWLEGEKYPKSVVFASSYPIRIWLKHYQYRSPQQIQKRLENRYKVGQEKKDSFGHEMRLEWQASVTQKHKEPSNLIATCPSWLDRIVKASSLCYDQHDRRYLVQEDFMPPIEYVPDESNLANKIYQKLKDYRSIIDR